MRRRDFDTLIDNGSFRELFITEMGWNNPDNCNPVLVSIDGQDYEFIPVADKHGFHVYSCTLDTIPTSSDCKKIDNRLRNYGYDYICIFVQSGTNHHLWLTPVKTNEKRELVKTEYIGGAKADFLFSKIDDLSFGLTEHVLISDVKARVQSSFHLNSEKVTKDFYVQFRKEHTAFKKHITGIDDDIPDKDNRNKDWYASVMLNRLMFCYFIQKKGFLDMNANYLQDKLRWVRQQQGENKFFGTFYKGFLCALFHDGLNNPRHDSDDFLAKYGRIPYLNGGMFDDHQLEREHSGIDIADEAFENLFNFFDKWNWHLDTRLTASGKDINPDVLGYIFEQYINDRTQKGAYYTKEDITEYIGRNCILPFLMDKTASATKDSAKAFEADGWIWQMLQQSGDKYIYDAVKKGHTSDWQQQIPDYISQGIDTTTGNLLERRSRWNENTHEDFALPTEIWRETIERLQRCDTLLQKIRGGEIHSINDFITYNLDIRQFTEDVIRQTKDHKFVAHFYHALQNITILDPTCGSGAFLFAALNILEPLYEACIDRMEEFHQKNSNLFVQELEEINAKYSSNRQYFIYKSIILRNIYGVDIMVEATEIAKLRLFLKMVAVVEVDRRKDNLGLDPLPDIDFNIKCGNTLVGYATEKQLDDALGQEGDMFANYEFKEKISMEMNVVSTAYNCFRSEQLRIYDDNASIKATKEMLKERLTKLNDLLNRYMHQAIATGSDYEEWLASHQPFHWLAEFYQIIKGNGGFDIVIGNPPYVEYSSVRDLYKVLDYSCLSSGNLYSFVIERSYTILADKRYVGMIVPISAFCTARMESFMNVLRSYSSTIHVSNYAERPAKLFEGAERNLSIMLCQKNTLSDNCAIYTTYYYKWKSENRCVLFSNLWYQGAERVCIASVFPKISCSTELLITERLRRVKKSVGFFTTRNSNYILYYKNSGGRYWKFMADFKPLFYLNGEKCSSSRETHLFFNNSVDLGVMTAILNSTLYFWYYVMHSDARTNNPSDLKDFPIDIFTLDDENKESLIRLSNSLMSELQANATMVNANYRTGDVSFAQYLPALSKPIIDEIDKVLAKHFGFTEEELDFIINYDIKYRMGDELNTEE